MTPDEVKDRRTFETFLRKAGFAKSLASRLSASWPSQPTDTPDPDELKAIADRLTANLAILERKN